MAYRIYNKNPFDVQRRQAIGFSLPINGSGVFNPTYTTEAQIKTNIVNYFLTNRGERVFNPNFGANLRKYIFENVDDVTIDALKKQIQLDIIKYFPTVKIEDLVINTDADRNAFNVKIYYSISKLGIEDSINIIIE
jgi:phage baseplate assembly protein W